MSNARIVVLVGLLAVILMYFGSEVHEFLEAVYGSPHEEPVSEPLWFIIFELIVILFSLCGILFLSRELLKERKHMAGLNKKYAGIQLQLKDANQKLKDGKKSFHQVIQWQFTEWKLSPSEQDVALLVLKGLSFKEIAALRETKEKTVRQQATSIYSKTGLNGRHEFAAWFFEDML